MAYITVDDVRAAGFSDEDKYSDDVVEASIARQQATIDRICRQWFEPEELTLLLDGTGSDTLFLDFPIVEVSELFVNGSFDTPIPVENYVVYNGRGRGRDDRDNPMIRLDSKRSGVFVCASKFRVGSQNQKIVGTFGYVEADDSTPEGIRTACLMLVIKDLASPPSLASGGSSGSGGGAAAGPVVSETTDGHSIRYAAPDIGGMRVGTTALTGDSKIDAILELYRAPRAHQVVT